MNAHAPARRHLLGAALALLSVAIAAAAAEPAPRAPIGIIFDTDLGNDVDDVLALGVLHAFQARGECRLLAVTTTKDNELVAPFIDAVDTFYGHGDIPIGVCRSGITPDAGRYLRLAEQRDDGVLRYPHRLMSGKQAPTAVEVLRRTLAAARDGGVAIVQVGFSTNLAALLDSPADAISPLAGPELITAKVAFISIMAGDFAGKGHREYNITNDIRAAKRLAEAWPTPVVWSGFEVGVAVATPHVGIERDFRYVAHHPLAEAYVLYQPPPHDRPAWDLTSALYAVRPDRGYFTLSPTGKVTVADDGATTFAPGEGRHQILRFDDAQRARVTEALLLLASEPPHAHPGATP
jgi:inosine-uridine nucleoside N-ribohydrolase